MVKNQDNDMKQKLMQLNDTLQTIGKEYPEYIKAFMGFMEQTEKDGALSVKNKELISLAIGVTERCKNCIAFHTKNAIDAGATKKEIFEAGLVAGLMGGGPAITYLKHLIDACDQFGAK